MTPEDLSALKHLKFLISKSENKMSSIIGNLDKKMDDTLLGMLLGSHKDLYRMLDSHYYRMYTLKVE